MSPSTILVADDELDILELICFQLERLGHETVRAHDGQQALRLARERRPSLCILDVVMPRGTGIEVLQALRESDETADIPVMLLTATIEDEYARAAAGGRADAYMRKPFSASELRRKVDELIEHGRRGPGP